MKKDAAGKAGWVTRKLGDFSAAISTGPFGSLLHKSDYVDNGVPLVNPTNMVNDRILPDASMLISETTRQRLNSYVLEEGDIVVGRRGEIGRCAVVGPTEAGWLCGTGSFFIRPLPSIDSQFLAHLIRSGTYRGRLEEAATGTTMKNLSNATLSDLVVSIPLLPEQRRIVAILDEAFDCIATGQGNAEKNLQNARALFESHLQAVFTQRGGCTSVPIGDIGTVFDGPHATPRTVDAGPIFLGISALQDGDVNLGETRHVTPEDFRRWTRRVRPQPGDVVFSYETRLGQAASIPDGLECCLGRRMGLVRVDRRRVEPRFFVYQYVSAPYREFLSSRTVRGATVDRIALKEFPSFPIILPPLDQQKAIVKMLDALKAETQRLEAIYRQKLAALDALKKSLLDEAFTGVL
jgi:type I restriction enzyme S subunit